MIRLNPFSSVQRPALAGDRGAVSAAHPLAAAAGQQMLMQGGNAVDALVAAQAVLAVIAPDACGLGGDAFVLLYDNDRPTAINGAGAAPQGAGSMAADGAQSVTVPGLVDSWSLLIPRMSLGLSESLGPAIRLATEGIRVDGGLIAARDAQAARLVAGGAADWPLMRAREGDSLRQLELARTLEAIASGGRNAFYGGAIAAEMLAVLKKGGSAMVQTDLDRAAATVETPLSVEFGGHDIHVQPPASQGVLLAMSLCAWEEGAFDPAVRDHIAVELTQAAFLHRDAIARGAALLDEPLEIDRNRASLRGGPRSYLHTAGICTADANGMVAASLVSVFDDFGSGVLVPGGGFVLNNRGGGFTSGGNAFSPGKRPVHTLAPVLVTGPQGVVALATPGADGQVQTLLQVLLSWLGAGADLTDAIAAPRWRSEDGALLVEDGHPSLLDLISKGHRTAPTQAGDMRFGAVTAAGIKNATPWALADWRRTTWAGVA